VLPVVTAVGFAAIVVSPVLPVFLSLTVARRVGEYAIAKPAREVLFTVLNREDKYKAKNFIDTARIARRRCLDRLAGVRGKGIGGDDRHRGRSACADDAALGLDRVETGSTGVCVTARIADRAVEGRLYSLKNRML